MQPAPHCPAPSCWWCMRASGVLLHWHLHLGMYAVCLFVFSPSHVAIWDSKHSPQTREWEGFLLFGNFSSFGTPSTGQVSVPNSFVFYILSYLLSKKMDCLSGCWCPPPAFRSCFVEVAQHSNDLLVNLWGREWSPRPILPPSSVISSGKISASCPFCPLKTPIILIFIYFMVSHRSHGFSLLFYFSFIFLLWLTVSNFIAPDHVVYILF